MSKDRIKDLQNNFGNHEDQAQVQNTHRQSTTINIDIQSPITNFLEETNIIRSSIDKINDLAQQVKRIHNETLQPLANPNLEKQLDDKTEEIKKLANETSTKLKKMEHAQENRDDNDKNNAQRRIKESQIFVLTRRFRDIMSQYNQDTVAHRERCKKIIVRELEIAGNKRTNDELEEMLENGTPGAFNFSIFVNTQKAKQSLAEIEARHRDIIKLENCIKELHNMYRDLAMLVTDQGEMIDCIEHNVSKAVEYVEDAAENVNIAEKYHKKAIKKKVIILIVLLTSVVLIVLIMFLGFFTQKKIRGR